MDGIGSLNVLRAVIEPGGEERLLIDGTEAYPGFRIDRYTLVESIIHEGEYEFYVCSCGEAGCAGIFVPQEVRYENNLIIWKVVEPKPEGEYRFDRDQYLDTLYEAFVRADGFKQGEREDFNIGPFGFYLDTFTKCLARLAQWREMRRKAASWEKIEKEHPYRAKPEER